MTLPVPLYTEDRTVGAPLLRQDLLAAPLGQVVENCQNHSVHEELYKQSDFRDCLVYKLPTTDSAVIPLHENGLF